MHSVHASAVHWDVLTEGAEVRLLWVHPSPVSDMVLSRALPSAVPSHIPQLQPGGGYSSQLSSLQFFSKKQLVSRRISSQTRKDRMSSVVVLAGCDCSMAVCFPYSKVLSFAEHDEKGP